MAYAAIPFTNPVTLETKVAPVGFSWTTLFFGFFPAILRGDFFNAIMMGVISVFTFGLAAFIFPFIYNKMYIRRLITRGFVAAPHFAGLGTIETALNMSIPQSRL